MSDIVKRLRAASKWPYNISSPNEPLMEEAAAEIERLRADWETARDAHDRRTAEVVRLRAALREIMGMDEVALVEFKKGDGWLHQRVARAALGEKA